MISNNRITVKHPKLHLYDVSLHDVVNCGKQGAANCALPGLDLDRLRRAVPDHGQRIERLGVRAIEGQGRWRRRRQQRHRCGGGRNTLLGAAAVVASLDRDFHTALPSVASNLSAQSLDPMYMTPE